ncbi:phosphate acetyltransferase [Gallaecimonas sp. GXIMD1310]|uniref:phosphate acetyltransferase n=1 Tax=Gallaecimonas sp. GXIMD1310 TaxID=3131926 RepID=UPI00324F074A
MTRILMLVPANRRVGMTSVSLGLVRAMEREGVSVGYFKPLPQLRHQQVLSDHSGTLIQQATGLTPIEAISAQALQHYLAEHNLPALLADIAQRLAAVSQPDVLVIEGLAPTREQPYAHQLNQHIAHHLDAEVILVVAPGIDDRNSLSARLKLIAEQYQDSRLIGAFINKIGAPVDQQGRIRPDLSDIFEYRRDDNAALDVTTLPCLNDQFRLLGQMPWDAELIAPRALDMARHLNADILNEGDIAKRRLTRVIFGTASLTRLVEQFHPGALLVTSGDRDDVIIAACLAARNGVAFGAILLTGGYQPSAEVMALCEGAFDTGLPVLSVATNTWQTSLNVQHFRLHVPADDRRRLQQVMDTLADHFAADFINDLLADSPRSQRLSPPAFKYRLLQMARQQQQRIVLPEGTEPRTLRAAVWCAEQGIAQCILLGKPQQVRQVASSQGIRLGDGVSIIDPDAVRERYVRPMMALRTAQHLEEVMAREQLQDNVVLATMMLAQNEADGLVSGAENTTVNTIRPALQLLKTAPGSELVSSVFFMLLPDQVLIYGDCAINPNPDAKQLAQIAVESADTARLFGIEPQLAMIGYAGAGDNSKVQAATERAQAMRPALSIEGPLQYDAAVIESVARARAPGSPVSGQASVFVFPDLNTGYSTYLAVQRSADLLSLGPMLQGMRKPVNDLARSATAEDIVYTIALTAIQAQAVTAPSP